MSGATPIRLPLSRRQADALAKMLERFFHGHGSRVAEKLTTLRDSR